MTSSEVFEKVFVLQKYRRMEDQKPGPGLALDQDFVKWRELKPNDKKRKCLKWETRRVNQCNSNVKQTRVWEEASSRWAIFCNFLKEKKNYFNAIGSHLTRVQSHLKELDL